MKTLALALGGLTAAWLAAPTVAMTARGTIDERTRHAWRAVAAGSRDAAPIVAIPAPRRGLDDRVPA